MNILCTLAQRNEVACLEPWVKYHAYMVGKENLHIIDNASDIPYVIDKIAEYESQGIRVTRIPPGTSLSIRGNYTADIIKEIEKDRHFDWVFPMDCDEFLAVYDHEGRPSCNRQDIYNYLHGLSSQRGVFEIRDGLENINGVHGRYIRRKFWKKVFFSYRECLNLDIGYHVGFPKNGLPVVKTDIFYLHMQVRPYHMFRYLARQKLESFVNPDDREALAAHTGANLHLVELFLKDEENYNRTLAERRLQEQDLEEDFPEFANLLRVIGIDPDFLNDPKYIELEKGAVEGRVTSGTNSTPAAPSAIGQTPPEPTPIIIAPEDKVTQFQEDETPEFWLCMPHEQVAHHAAALQAFWRQQPIELDRARMIATRLAMSAWLHGTGIEVGADDRPFLVRDELKVLYGDVRDNAGLREYFGDSALALGGDTRIDAQTFEGIPDQSVDFVISAHVIEHLLDPVGSIQQAMRVIKPGGLYLIAVPDMRYTFDRARPETTLEHVFEDYKDGGIGTQLEAYREIAQHVLGHTPEEAIKMAPGMLAGNMDIHVHAWSYEGFKALLRRCESLFPMRLEAGILNNNENIFALRKT